MDSSSVRRGLSRRAFFPAGIATRAGALFRATAFFRRAGLRAAFFRDALRTRAFGRAERLGLVAFRAPFAFLTLPLAVRLAIVPAPSATLTVLR
jgi:hypothetical protein